MIGDIDASRLDGFSIVRPVALIISQSGGAVCDTIPHDQVYSAATAAARAASSEPAGKYQGRDGATIGTALAAIIGGSDNIGQWTPAGRS